MKNIEMTTDGKIFYRVEYNGVITALKVIEEMPNGDKKMACSKTALTRITELGHSFVDEWTFEPSGATQEFNPEKPEYMDRFFLDLGTAKEKSLENFQKHYNPSAMYRVAKYFDDVFDGYVSQAMPKADALQKVKEFKGSALYTRFRIVVDGNHY